MWIEAATNVLLYAAVLQTVGAATAFWLVEPEPAVGARIRRVVENAIRRVGLRASIAVVLTLVMRAWAHTAATFGMAQSLTWNAFSTIAVESRWGRGWQIQILAGLACIVAYGLAGRGRGRQPLTVVAGAALAVALTNTGHASGAPDRMAIHAAHVLGAGTWLGTLTTLVGVRSAVEHALRRSMFLRFSRVALAGAGVLVAAGMVASWWYVGSFGNLWTTAYGRVLLIKVALVGGVVACGYVNWRAIESGQIEPGRAAIVELILAGLVVGVTGLLTEIEHPR